jgi:succinate-acetate transporter protein
MSNVINDSSEKHDLEAAIGGTGGSPLSRQISVTLTHEQFERLYLQPGGERSKGDAAQRLGNPTPFGTASFLLCLTPFAIDLMGWSGVSSAATLTLTGAAYWIGAVGLILAGIFEIIIGNTFPATVFITFGGFWGAQGFSQSPTQLITTTLGAGGVDYNHGTAIYLACWASLTLIYLIASLRVNIAFFALFFFLDIQFWVLVATYMYIPLGPTQHNLLQLLQVAGAFGFLAALCGWYILVVLIFGTTGIPIQLPIGDLSGFLSGKAKQG